MGLTSWNRRGFLGSVAVAVSSLLMPRRASGTTRTSPGDSGLSGFGQSGSPYEELGVSTVINAEGTMTMLGGSLIHPEVEVVMAQASRHFVHIPELEEAAGRRIAEMLKLPDGYSALVTSGAAAAMQSGLAGVLTGDNPKFIEQIPDLTGMKSEVI